MLYSRLFPLSAFRETVHFPPIATALVPSNGSTHHIAMRSRAPRTALPIHISQTSRSSHLPYANLRPPKRSLFSHPNVSPLPSSCRPSKHFRAPSSCPACRSSAFLTRIRPPSLSPLRPAQPGRISPPPFPSARQRPNPIPSRNFSCLSPAPSI